MGCNDGPGGAESAPEWERSMMSPRRARRLLRQHRSDQPSESGVAQTGKVRDAERSMQRT